MFLSPSWRDEGITTPRQQPEVLYALALGMTSRTREQLDEFLDLGAETAGQAASTLTNQ